MSNFDIIHVFNYLRRTHRLDVANPEDLDPRIRLFIEADHVEARQGKEPCKAPWELPRPFDRYLDDQLARLRNLRLAIMEVLREGTTGSQKERIDTWTREMKEHYEVIAREIEKEHQIDRDKYCTEFGREMVAVLEADGNSMTKRWKLAQSSFLKDGLAIAAGDSQDRMSQIDYAMDLLEMHRMITLLAQSELWLDPHFFEYNGMLQGQISLQSITASDMRKNGHGRWTITLYWEPIEDPVAIPRSVLIRQFLAGKFSLPIFDWMSVLHSGVPTTTTEPWRLNVILVDETAMAPKNMMPDIVRSREEF
ncbi:hypothetical protein PT974_03725 [Cladobotryum mycophilum]|uniref:Uncharacterized protein n=1 Tax=Cladobotryum mycophilum TaxID=491253 RepID=A0ABR0ST37_9HYPO